MSPEFVEALTAFFESVTESLERINDSLDRLIEPEVEHVASTHKWCATFGKYAMLSGEGRIWSKCSCGWQGTTWKTEAEALTEWRLNHLSMDEEPLYKMGDRVRFKTGTSGEGEGVVVAFNSKGEFFVEADNENTLTGSLRHRLRADELSPL